MQITNIELCAGELVFTHNNSTYAVSDDTVELLAQGDASYIVAYDIESQEEFDAQAYDFSEEENAQLISLAQQAQ